MTDVVVIADVRAVSADLHEDDASVEGVYGIVLGDAPGAYPTTPRTPADAGDDPMIEAAKDVFHDHVGIRVLDDFDIAFRIVETVPEGGDVHWL